MYLYRLVGEVVVTDYDAKDCAAPAVHIRETTHILSVSVLWPEPLDDMQVEAHVVGDLLRDHNYSQDVDWGWNHGPDVRKVSEAEQLRALGVPEMFIIEEPDHV